MYNGPNNGSDLIASLSGSGFSLPNYLSGGDTMLLEFESDSTHVRATEWRLHYAIFGEILYVRLKYLRSQS